ncbi:MAG: hypothetical protein MK074_02805 [Phycisphaerales bacterium]|nr:hypothetical protein [Phycisphaerales bacterium]
MKLREGLGLRQGALAAAVSVLSITTLAQADAWIMSEGWMNYGADYNWSPYSETINMLDYPGGYNTGNGMYDTIGSGIDMWAAYSESSSSESNSWGDSWDTYEYESTDFWLQISTDTGLVIDGWGDMGYRFQNSATGADFTGATGNLSEFTLGAGTWTITFADMGHGEGSSYEDYWESEDGSEWYYSYQSSYSANGGMTIDVGVPGPSVVALFGIAGLAGRRRRR